MVLLGDCAALVDVIECLPNEIQVHLYGLPWQKVASPTEQHSDAEGALVARAAQWKVSTMALKVGHAENWRTES